MTPLEPSYEEREEWNRDWEYILKKKNQVERII